MMLHDQFVHLHTVSGYSFKYGTALPQNLVAAAAEKGMKSLALTDRDTLAGTIRFIKAAMEFGITPIVGINIKLLSDKNRVTLLAKTDGGYGSLVQLISGINLKLSYGQKPIITREILKEFSQYSKDLILLHGPDSLLQKNIWNKEISIGKSHFNYLKDFFEEQFIECVSHLDSFGSRSTAYAAKALSFARDNNIPAILSNDVRMISPEDAPIADILDSSRNLQPLHLKNIRRKNAEAFLKPGYEMYKVARDITNMAGERSENRLLADTYQLAEKLALSPTSDIGIGEISLPDPEMVGVKNHREMIYLFRQRSLSALQSKYRSEPNYQEALIRLNDELNVIRTLGFEPYFLTVADIVKGARDLGIRVAARGSGAGSLICYLLDISAVDPLAHGLIMERFCSPLRRELPDIDIDVESARRLEIYDLVFQKYGGQVATVSMVEKYRARHAIRDVGAALGIAPMEIDLIAKSIPRVRAGKISEVIEKLPELRSIAALRSSSALLQMAVGLAERLDSLPRNLAMHPCAVTLSNLAFKTRAPLEINASGYPMIQFDKDDVEDIGLLKLDILGVRMQSSLAYTIAEIKKVDNEIVDLEKIPLDDSKTFTLIQSTQTLGIFQIESPGQRELVGKFSPSSFNDLIIDISLFRPGPIKSEMISPFLNARHGDKPIKLIHPDLDKVLAETEGVVVFHEQVIRIISILTGSSLAAGDAKRRDLGTPEGEERVRDWLFPAALSKGYSRDLIDEMWQVLRAFASFGFCKAHATAFALTTYQSAWLKAHYPAHFLAGVLNHDPGMYPKRLLLDEVRRLGIEIKPVDINYSDNQYRVIKVDEKYAIELPLSQLHGISDQEVRSIIAHRPYSDLADFVYRSGASKPISEALLLLGAFSSIYGKDSNRRDLLLHLNDIYQISQSRDRIISDDQMSLGFLPEFIETGLPNITKSDQVRNELNLLGMEVSHNVIEFYSDFLNSIGAVKSSELLSYRSQTEVLVAGVKVALQTPPIRSGKRVIFLTLNDGYGCSDLTFFEDAQDSYAELLYSTSLFLVRGITRRTGARGISIRATKAWDLTASYERWRTVAVYG